MHIGKIGQFLEVWVFPATNVGLCVHGPCKTTGDLQNTPGTPAMHFPLVVAGSQSALYVIHLGRWSRVQKRYQGGWGGGPQLQLPCPMPPSAVAAGPVKKMGVRFTDLAVQQSATIDRGLGQGNCSWGGLARPPWSPFQAPDRPSKRTACRSRRIGASPTPPLQRPQKTLRSHT